MADEVRLVDTTLRDGQMSLWALRMRAGMMLPALADIDAAGFDGIEFVVPAGQLSRLARDLNEDPWIWLREGTSVARNTPLRLHGSVGSYFTNVPACVEHLFLAKLRDLGITTTRTSDPWNDFDNITGQFDNFRRHDFKIVLNIIYSVSPRHTADYYAERTRKAAALRPYRLCFKDVGGILTPEAAREIIPVVLANAGDVPVEFHAHCNSGLAPYCVLVAAELGIRIIHTAIPPLANGSSQPSVFNVVRNLRDKGFDVRVDTAPLERVERHFSQIAEREGLPVGEPKEYSQNLYRHQVPGGMISNLVFQLDQAGMGDRIDETLDETARVREELGYPIMVTPLSQFVGTQAAINVMTGERYSVVTDEIIGYALGRWGGEAIEVMDPGVRARILDRSRARDLEKQFARTKEEPTLSEVRQQYGGGISDEELITRIYSGIGQGELNLSQDTAIPRTYDEYQRRHAPLEHMLSQFSAASQVRRLDYRGPGGRLVAEK